MPKIEVTGGDAFLHKNLKDNTNLATWDGELYLEMHRGTFTTKSNLKKLTGYTDYSYYQNAIIINPDDYNSLYDKPSYQSSVYVKDASIIDQTMSELENLGLKPKKATDFKVEYENESQIVKIFKVVVTIFVIIVVFFISYLIISIILKSTN